MKNLILFCFALCLVCEAFGQFNYSSNTITGYKASASGTNNTATGSRSFTSGLYNVSNGSYSISLGYSNVASGYNSIAIGRSNRAIGSYSFASGYSSYANGRSSFAANTSNAFGDYAASFGDASATGDYSLAFGNLSRAQGTNSFSGGALSYAYGNNSFAFGGLNSVKGLNAIGMGAFVSTNADYAISLGYGASSNATKSVCIGNGVRSTTNAVNSIVLGSGTSGASLENSKANSLAVGFNSNIPTLFIGPSSGVNTIGKVGIGTENPQNELDVNGTARAKEIKVEEGWGDYVFLADYQLPTLGQEAQHIQEKGHLSGFQSAEEMNGEIQLGDVTKRQQVKIEEMMLHIIKMNERLEKLEAENAQLKAKNVKK